LDNDEAFPAFLAVELTIDDDRVTSHRKQLIWEKKRKSGKKRVTVEKTMSCFLFCRMGVDKHGPPSPRHTSVSEAAVGRAGEFGQGPC